MKHDTRRTASGSAPANVTQSHTTISVPAARNAAGATTIRLSAEHLARIGRAERAFSADGGYVAERGDLSALRLVQLDPFHPSKAIRVVVLRWERERFQQQIEALKAFYQECKDQLKRDETEYEGLAEIVRNALPDGASGSSVAVLDVDALIVVRGGSRIQFVFMSFCPAEYHAIVTGHRSTVSVKADLDVTMPIGAMVSMLADWFRAVDLEA